MGLFGRAPQRRFKNTFVIHVSQTLILKSEVYLDGVQVGVTQ
jgi:hypothetical protein